MYICLCFGIYVCDGMGDADTYINRVVVIHTYIHELIVSLVCAGLRHADLIREHTYIHTYIHTYTHAGRVSFADSIEKEAPWLDLSPNFLRSEEWSQEGAALSYAHMDMRDITAGNSVELARSMQYELIEQDKRARAAEQEVYKASAFFLLPLNARC